MKRITRSLLLSAALLAQVGSASAAGDRLWIADEFTKTIYEVTLDGTLISSFPQRKGATSGIDVDPGDGSLWGTDDAPSRIVNFTRTGGLISYFFGDLFGAASTEGVAVDPDGTLWIVDDPQPSDGVPAAVLNITREGVLLSGFPTAAFDPASRSPQAIDLDPFDGTFWITDNRTSSVYNVDRAGGLLLAIPSASFDPDALNLQGISVDGSNGTLWVTSRDTSRIYNISRKGALLASFPSSTYDGLSLDPTGIAHEPAEPAVEVHVLDEFEVVSFSNQDGADDWATDWIEEDVAGAGPDAGNARIAGGALELNDHPNTGTQPSLGRQVDLEGAASATLRFDFETSSGVDWRDTVILEISDDGGADYTTLEVFKDIQGATRGTRSYDIGAFASAETRVRFRVRKRYGGSDEVFRVEFLEIATPRSGPPSDRIQVLDEFEVVSFSNQDGTHDWAADWVEDDVAGTGPRAGNARVVDGALDLNDYEDTGTQPSLARQLDLAGASSASLRFDFSTTPGVDTTDAVTVEISDDGGASYSPLEVLTGIEGASKGSRRYDVSRFASDRTRVRFRVSNLYGAFDESFRVEFVEIIGEGGL